MSITKTQRKRLQTFLSLLLLAVAVSLVMLGLLWQQMAKGKDPVLQQERPIVYKTVYVTPDGTKQSTPPSTQEPQEPVVTSAS